MKLYGIAWRRESPRAESLEAAKRIAAEELRNAASNNYKLGFIGAHGGRDACFVFVDLRKANAPDFQAYLDDRLNEQA